MIRAFILRALLLTSALPLSAQGHVHVVDAAGGPGSDFTALAPALAAAADGDVLLLRAGTYFDALNLSGKGLFVTADAGATVVVFSGSVTNIPAGRYAALQGLTMDGQGSGPSIHQASGVVWMEGCSVRPGTGAFGSGGTSVVSCSSVVLSRCLFDVPRFDVLLLGPPAPALFARGSCLHVFDSRVQPVYDDEPSPLALALESSFLELSGSSVLGDDGNGSPFSCDGQDGGDALVLTDSSTAVILDSLLRGGAGGAVFGSCAPSVAGEDLVVGPGSRATFLTGKARSLSVASPVREGQDALTLLTGKPGDQVWVLCAATPGPGVASRSYDGELLVGSPHRSVTFGTIPPSGTLTVHVRAPDLPAGVESRVFFLQAAFAASTLGASCSRPRARPSCWTELSGSRPGARAGLEPALPSFVRVNGPTRTPVHGRRPPRASGQALA
jgi:hypothetical protein